MDIRLIIRIHQLILDQRTGKPKDLASRLGISERSVYNYIGYMKNNLNAPISYEAMKQSYYYSSECNLNFKVNDISLLDE